MELYQYVPTIQYKIYHMLATHIYQTQKRQRAISSVIQFISEDQANSMENTLFTSRSQSSHNIPGSPSSCSICCHSHTTSHSPISDMASKT